jgi:hypothetical protein
MQYKITNLSSPKNIKEFDFITQKTLSRNKIWVSKPSLENSTKCLNKNKTKT